MRKDVRRRKLKQICSVTHLFLAKATAKVERKILRKKANTIKMDVELKTRLEAIRQRTPRYLFRLWSNSEEETPNGGYVDLNTTTAITPLAFSRGNGHKSVYHMTKEEFTKMAYCHLHTCDHIETEFSSWSASLTFILNKCPGVGTGGVKLASRSHENLHVSVIDTKWLWGTNQVFYAPLLDFLRPGEFGYPHEYLLHGVVQGRWYKAVPYSVLESSAGFKFSSDWYFRSDEVECAPLTKEVVDMARAAARLFGEMWTLPMLLALLCCQKRDKGLWKRGVDEIDLQKVLDGIQGLRIPESWKKDKTITGRGVISSKNYSDTRQLTRLIRALVRRTRTMSRDNLGDDELSGDEESEYGEGAVEDELPDLVPDGTTVEGEAIKEGSMERKAMKVGSTQTVDSDIQDDTEIAEPDILDGLEKRLRQTKVAKDQTRWSGRKGKAFQVPDRVEKHSDAKAAAKAVWQRKHGTGRLTKLKPAS